MQPNHHQQQQHTGGEGRRRKGRRGPVLVSMAWPGRRETGKGKTTRPVENIISPGIDFFFALHIIFGQQRTSTCWDWVIACVVFCCCCCSTSLPSSFINKIRVQILFNRKAGLETKATLTTGLYDKQGRSFMYRQLGCSCQREHDNTRINLNVLDKRRSIKLN